VVQEYQNFLFIMPVLLIYFLFGQQSTVLLPCSTWWSYDAL